MHKQVFIFLLGFGSLGAQTIATDRPDQTETTAITPVGFIQIETGFLYEKVGPGSENFSHPSVLWKYGINEYFELRFETEFKSGKADEEYVAGFSPFAVGFKARLAEEKVFFPEISFIGSLQVGKLTSSGFKTLHAAPSFRFLFQHTLTEKLNIGYNLGAEWDGETAIATVIYTVSASYAFTEKLACFAELYGFLNKSEHADHRFDAGFTYLLNDNLMIDASSGLGLSSISPTYFVSAGISYRSRVK